MVVAMITAKAAIFDTDCTLVNTIGRFFEVFNRMLEERGEDPLSWKDFYRRYVEDSLDEIVVTPKTMGRGERLHEFWMEFLRRYREGGLKSKLYPGVKKLLEKLHRMGVPIAVITSCIVPPDNLREELADLGIDAFVRAFATAHDVVENLERGHHFSKVDIFRKAAKRLSVNPEDCVVVGDYWNDIRDGNKVGAKTVGVLSGLTRRGLLEKYKPDAIIESTKDLLNVVKFEAQNP